MRIYSHILFRMSAEQNNSSGQQIESQQTRDLTQLKKQIQLSNIQLLQLTYNDEKFINHLNDLNIKGVQSVLNEDHRQAVVYFNQCQKILQYAASCGKTMDRSIIVVTLHNQACVNQKLWDLEKSANYLQAIIYNINFYFENNKKQQRDKSQLDTMCGIMHKKQLFALYHLQFCAVNSQIRKHSISLSSAKSGIKIMKELCRQSYKMNEKIVYNDPLQLNQSKKNSSIFNELANIQEELVISDYQKFFAIVKQIMQQKVRKESSNEEQLKNVKNFSIGKLMQLIPITIEELQSKFSAKQWMRSENVTNIALYIGVCYFTVGTQLRFLSSQNHEEGNQVYKISQEYLISEVYHIFAIMIVMKYVPVRSIFLNHLLTSFNSHYEIDLQKILINNPPNQIVIPHQTGSLSNQNSIQLPLIASLPQQSSITGTQNQAITNININTPSKIQTTQKIQEKKSVIENKFSNLKTKRNSKDEKQTKANLIDTHYKTQRSKSPKFELKNESKPKKREKKRSNEKLRCQTFININRKNETQRYQNSIKNKKSKSKSEYRKSLSKRKKSDQKQCIYTRKSKKDFQIELKRKSDEERASFEKKKSKASKDKMGKLLSMEIKLVKSKSKQKNSLRNVLGKQVKKQHAQQGEHQQKSKNKIKNKKPQIKMHKVEGAKNNMKTR